MGSLLESSSRRGALWAFTQLGRRILAVCSSPAPGPQGLETVPDGVHFDSMDSHESSRMTSPTDYSFDGVQRPGDAANDSSPRGPAGMRPLPEDAVIVVPVRSLVVFPGLVVPLGIGRERSRAAVQEAVRLERPIGLLMKKDPALDEPAADDLHWVGTTAPVLRYFTAPDGNHHAIVKGARRFRVLQFLEGYHFAVARVQYIEDANVGDPQVEGRARALRERALEVVQLLPQVPEEVLAAFNAVEGASELADFIAGMMDIAPEEKQSLLEAFDLRSRLDKILELPRPTPSGRRSPPPC